MRKRFTLCRTRKRLHSSQTSRTRAREGAARSTAYTKKNKCSPNCVAHEKGQGFPQNCRRVHWEASLHKRTKKLLDRTATSARTDRTEYTRDGSSKRIAKKTSYWTDRTDQHAKCRSGQIWQIKIVKIVRLDRSESSSNRFALTRQIRPIALTRQMRQLGPKSDFDTNL